MQFQTLRALEALWRCAQLDQQLGGHR
jgi:hypothetical protein